MYYVHLILVILEKEGLPICPKLVDGVEAYPWHITTKYYESDVLLYTLSEKKLLPESLAKGVQAVIVVFDSLKVKVILFSAQLDI